MSYLVLARKWRPRDFDSLVGQDHVVRALSHALTTQRLHHAWLFTGTRGVGKTTLSRILAKSLNCETGITAHPCGQCAACQQIDEGRFVDYVELDAASNRGVDEMTQLLEQAVYAPSAARFKVYMIDEVHMLTGHAFNAMLKTLEEPPAHVKFILATTDPQKIPATVLSRCLQFNLKPMVAQDIAGYLNTVLTAENVAFEEPALRLIGQAASGSMRDALSLTDQAIAYTSADLSVATVREMLGTVDQGHLVQLLDSLAQGDANAVVQTVQTIVDLGLSLRQALSDLAILLSKLALLQRTGVCELEDSLLLPRMQVLAEHMPSDLVQLFYTVAVHSREEMTLAPDEHAGFLMICLRMLGFVESATTEVQKKTLQDLKAASDEVIKNTASPDVNAETNAATDTASKAGSSADFKKDSPIDSQVDSEVSGQLASAPEEKLVESPKPQSESKPESESATHTEPTHAQAPEPQPEPEVAPAPKPVEPVSAQVDAPTTSSQDSHVEPMQTTAAAEQPIQAEAPEKEAEAIEDPIPEPEVAVEVESVSEPEHELELEPEPEAVAEPDTSQDVSHDVSAASISAESSAQLQAIADDWAVFVETLPVEGLSRELAMQSVCTGVHGNHLNLLVQTGALARGAHVKRLQTIIREATGLTVTLKVTIGEFGDAKSAQQLAQIAYEARVEKAREQLQNDPFVKALVQEFDAQMIADSVRP